LRALPDPVVDARGVEHHALLGALGDGVVVAQALDVAAVARAARVGDDDVVEGALLGAAAGEADLDHGGFRVAQSPGWRGKPGIVAEDVPPRDTLARVRHALQPGHRLDAGLAAGWGIRPGAVRGAAMGSRQAASAAPGRSPRRRPARARPPGRSPGRRANSTRTPRAWPRAPPGAPAAAAAVCLRRQARRRAAAG